MPKKKLYIELDYAFLCYGISCHHKDYRLAWNINEALTIRLEKKEAIVIQDDLIKDGIGFSKFCFFEEKTQTEYSLLGNRNKWGFLIPEEAMIDYFFLIKSDRINTDLIENELKSIDIILSFGTFNVDSLKNKERLLM
ncbi:MAG: IPExxxVDY family protein [Bacteroidota bacterium]